MRIKPFDFVPVVLEDLKAWLLPGLLDEESFPPKSPKVTKTWVKQGHDWVLIHDRSKEMTEHIDKVVYSVKGGGGAYPEARGNIGGAGRSQDGNPIEVELETTDGVIQATKHDLGKPRMSLIPVRAKIAIAGVFTYGATKYETGNWHQGNGFDWDRLQDAAERHLDAFNLGEDNDPESGLPHLAHMGCCVMMLLEHQLTHLGTDTRERNQITEEAAKKILGALGSMA